MLSLRTRLCTIAVGMLAMAATHSVLAQTIITSYGPISVTNLGGGQLSNPYFTFTVSTAGQLDVEYIASSGHCSNVLMHFLVDGVERAVSGVLAPGQTTGFVTLGPVAAGTHVVGLQAEGVVSGCNTGTLGNWGGSANARTVPISVVTAPEAIPAPGLLATALFFLGGAWLASRRRRFAR